MDFVPHTPEEREAMCGSLGIKSVAELFADIPGAVRYSGNPGIPPSMSERDLLIHLKELSNQNTTVEDYISFLGAGAYQHHIPSLIRHLTHRAEFYTAYTPYQPEISQGTLRVIFEFQTMLCQLTGMDVGNASMYDGATAMAEAALMACQEGRNRRVLVSAAVHPEYRETLATYGAAQQLEIVTVPSKEGSTDLQALENLLQAPAGCVIIQNPNFFGIIEQGQSVGDIAKKARSTLIVVVADAISLGLLRPPGQYGADIVAMEGQALGIPLSFGGPYLGFLAAREKFMRRMPGRIVGRTKDQQGRTGYVLTLQSREQHIRREKATSNICSNEALCALSATIYLALLGKSGLKQLAELCFHKAHYLSQVLDQLPGVKVTFDEPFFREFAIKTPIEPDLLLKRLREARIIGGLSLGRYYPELGGSSLWCVGEIHRRSDLDRLGAAIGGIR
ncbi:MAG: aminomethyl-transferring glycine dehydrogenase subunit GcvPA [Bacillota bacterium]